VFNSKDEEKGKWVTIKGNHIFIPDGKTLDEVIKEKGWGDKGEGKSKDQQSDTKDKHGFKKDKDSGYYMKDLSDGTSVYVEKKEGGQGEKEPFYLEATHFDKDGKTIAKKQYHYDSMDGMFAKIDKDFVSKDKQSDTEGEKTENLKDNDYSAYFSDKRTGMSMYDDVLEDKNYAETKQRFPKLIEMSPDDYIEIVRQGFNKNYEKYGEKERVKTKEQLIASRKDKSLSDLRNKFGKVKLDMPMIAYDTREDGDIEMSSQEGLHRAILAKEQGIKNIPVAIYSTVRYGEKVSSELLKENLDYLTEGFKEIKKLNDIDNSKEQDMLLEELKKLIFKVENSKENEEMIDNEKVDKRKLIDEVAGIMKSAGCDDEDIRTAIGKMEKIGYDKSEEGSADNKKVKNEEPEKKDDIDNKKVKNEEDDKKVDNEDAEDEKKVDELKKEEKEDIDNKCKNSKSSFDKINEIYNSVKQISEEKTYVSRQEKLDNAVEYFK
jgi:hypothetical protein